MNEEKTDRPDPLDEFVAKMRAHVVAIRINMNELTEATKEKVVQQDPRALAAIVHKIAQYQLTEEVILRRLRWLERMRKRENEEASL